MRSLILSLLFVATSVISYGQAFETCADSQMPGNTSNLTVPPTVMTTITVDGAWTTNADLYTPTSLAPGFATAYWSFTVSTMGAYFINIEGAPGSPSIGADVSMSLGTDCFALVTGSEIFTGIVPANLAPETATCTVFNPGTTYTIALAIDPALAGDIIISITNNPAGGATNENCSGATPITTAGTTVGNNSCSDGLVWYSYTVVNGGTVSVGTSVASTGNEILNPVLTQTSIDGCVTFETTASWTCLPVGTIINFEVGDNLAPIEQGDFNIDITDDASGLTNEICADVMATPVPAASCMTTTLTDATNNSTVMACQELLNFDACNVFNTEGTVWFAFTTDADAQTVDIELTNGTISGSTFVLIDGSAGCPSSATTLAGCQTTGSLLDQSISANTTYYIAVATNIGGTDGDFTLTVTPENPPSNDDCAAGAIDISTTAAAGVDGTTACASSDANDFCAIITEDHVVYYEYTVDATITTNRTITITTTGANVPISGADATDLGLGIFGDCFGAVATMPSGANLLPVAGTDLCDALTGDLVFECVEPGTSFTIAVASSDGLEGDFSIMITEMETGDAANDICDIASNPDITSVTMGTNFCADGELSFCGMTSTADHQVWYQYTNNTGANVDLGLTFTGTGLTTSATDLSMVVLVGDCGTTIFSGTTDADYCNILDAGEQVISCIENGETISILLGSAEDPNVAGPEGNFNISAIEISNSPANDECTDAIDITPPTCEWTLASVLTPGPTAENACPEDFTVFPAGCNFTLESTVWYSITVPNDAETYTLEFQNISDDAFLSVFEDTGVDCDAYGTPSINSDCESGAGPHGAAYDNLTNGATYLIAVGDPTEGGGFDFEIKLNQLPTNDECVDAEVLALGTPATNASTLCATADVADPSTICDPVTEESSVWYSYDVVADTKTLTLSLTGLTGGGNVNIMAVDACNSTTYYNDDNNNEVCGVGAADLEIDCPVVGTTIFFMVTTSEAEEGDYTLTLTETQTIDVTNDDCANAIDITPAMTCTDLQTLAMTNETACPEDFDIGGCGFDVEEVVWFSIDIPMGATTLDLGINSYAGVGNGFFSLFSECATPTQIDGNCYTTVSGGDFTLTEEIDVTGFVNTTIFVGFGSNGVGDDGGDVVFDIRIDIPPVNDECDDALPLVDGTMGSTLCASDEDPAFISGTCPMADQENTVFYTITVPPEDKGFNITINADAASATPLATGMVIHTALFETTGCDISNGTLTEEDCMTTDGESMAFECVGPGDYTIRISTSDINSGDFTVSITPLVAVANDFCDMPDQTAFAAQLECEWMDATATTTDACPEHMNLDPTNCGIDDFPVVWFEATAPANATFLDLMILNGGVNPFIAVYNPGPDCDDLTFVPGSTCFSGTFNELNDLGQNQISVTPGSTFLIAVGTDALAGGIINFSIKWITPPDNDECADAEVFTPVATGNPGESSMTLIGETTQCATEPFAVTSCPADDNNQTVWYTYTVEPDVKEITIDIANWTNTVTGGVEQFSLAVLNGCDPGGMLLTQADGSQAEHCGAGGEDLIKLSCLDEGDVIQIMVSSSSDNEGMFDITLNTLMPVCDYTNDECADASALTGNPAPLITDDPNDCVLVEGCNDLACAEAPFDLPCGIQALNTVFYTFMTDADVDPVDGAFVNIEVTNGEAGELDSPGAVLFDGNCVTAIIGACAGTGGLGIFNSGPLGGPGIIQPNTTYTIMIFNTDDTQNGGTFDLCVTVSSGCVNDDICDAFTLDPGVTVDNPASSNGCTDDFDVSGCGPAQNEATLWYQVDVPEGASSIEITLNNQTAPDGVTGDVSIAVGPLVDCNALDVNDVLYQDCAGFTTDGGIHTINCAVEFGTFWIQIGSEDDMEAGDFTITYNFNINPDPANDLCSTAEELVVDVFCETVTFPGTLKDACPELFDLGACEYSANQAVWYTITIPAGPPTVTDMDIEIMGLANPMIGVFEFDCMNAGDPANNNGIINSTMNPDGTVDCSQMPLTEGILVTPGNTFHILVSTSTMEDIAFEISIKLNAPPDNDDPCEDSVNAPEDLTGGGSHSGTTCCARGPKDENPDGSVADFENEGCSSATEDASVWYVYTPSEDDDGYNIILEPGDVEGPTSVEVYSGVPSAGCDGSFTLIAQSCNSNTADINVPNCFAPGDILFVKVTTDDPDENCGTFILTIVPASCDFPSADECIDATDVIGPTVTDINCENFDEIPFQGCLDFACSETIVADCMFNNNPTVWIQVEVDDLAQQLVVDVTNNGDWDPVWAIYTGPCDALELVQGGTNGALTSCSDDDSSPAHQVPVAGGLDGLPLTNTYFVAISAQNFDPGDDGSFQGTVLTTAGCVSCIGGNDDFSIACNNTGVWEVTDRSSDRPLDDLQFCVGEEVTICATLDYDASATSVDWLHGVIPNFGPGWDIEAFDGSTATLDATAGGNPGDWFEADGGCAPFITETMPLLCTYTDDNGVLRICNDFCGTCPCSSPLEAGSPLPSGWFWNGPGGQAACGSDCSPSDNFGIGAVTTTVEICFTISVRQFESQEECIENNDLQIAFITTSDGVSGCYDDPTAECTLDAPQFSPPWQVDCDTPPAVIGPDQEVCNETLLDLQVQTEDGSTLQINVDVVENQFVSGENSHVFNGGVGVIDDALVNDSDVTQVVIYIVYSIDPDNPCPGPINEIEVTIHPDLEVIIPPTDVCEGDCIDITPTIIGGAGEPYTYVWSTGETTPSINVCPIISTTYEVTVTDILGCMGVGDVEVIVNPPVEFSFEEDPIEACQDGNFDILQPEYIATIVFDSGTPPYSVNWLPGVGLIGQATSVNGFNDSWIINEEASSSFMSPYELCAEVTDAAGCISQECMTVNITGLITLVSEVLNLECGVDEAQIRITGLDNLGNAITDFNLFGGCPKTDLLETAFSNSGVVTFNINSTFLNNYSEFTIEAVTASGCVASICVPLDIPQGTPIEISGDENICIGDNATITITNAAAAGYNSYVWTPDVGTSESVTVSPIATTTYFVETMDAVGCVSDTSFIVMVNPEPIIGLAGTTTFCAGGTATITATGGDTYNWTGTNGTADGDSYTADMAGIVSLEVVNQFGCISDTTITFTEESVITVNIGGPNLCDGNPDTLFVVGSFTSYEWMFNAQAVGTDSILIITESGTYDINVVDITGCPGVGTIDINNFSTPQAMVTDTLTVCNEDSGVGPVTVNFDTQVTGEAGVWTQLTNVVSFDPDNASSVDYTGVAPGCYAYVYTTLNAEAPCMNTSDTLYVCVEACPCPQPNTSMVPDLCNDDTYDLSDSQVTLASGTWNTIAGPTSQDLTGLIVGSVFDANGILPGIYTVEFTLTAPGNSPPCEISSTQDFEVFEALEVTTVEGTMCNIPGQPFPTMLDLYTLISLDASDGGTWSQVGTPLITITGGSMIDATELTDFPVDLVFTYTSSDPIGPCDPVTVTVDVEIRDCACIFVDVLADTLCTNGGMIDLNDLLENPGDLAGDWSVNPGAITGTSMFNSDVTSGPYTITYTLTESAGPGCDEEYSNVLIVRRQPEIEFVNGPLPCSEDTGNGPTSIDLYDWLSSNTSSGSWSQTGGSSITFTDDGTTAIVDFDPFAPLDQFEFTYTTNAANDPCTDISLPLTITVQDCECPPIALGNPVPICNDLGMVDMCALIGTSDPGTFMVLNSSGNPVDVIDATGCIFDAIDINPGTYTIIYTLDQVVTGSCQQADTVTVDVIEYLSTEISDPEIVCNDPNGIGLASFVNFTGLLTNAGIGTWSDDDGAGVILGDSNVETNVSFIGVPVGSYNFTYTIENDEPCDDFVQTITVTVTDDCNCAPINALDPGAECNTDGPIDLTQYDDAANPGTWSSDELTVENGNSLILGDNVSAGVYMLTYTINSPEEGCPDTDEVLIVIGEPANPGTPADDFRLCEGTSEVIVLDDRLEGEDAGGIWMETSATMSTGFSGNMFDSDGQSAGTYTFMYSITGNDPCPSVNESVTIIIDPNPLADAGIMGSIDCQNTTAMIGGNSTTGDDITYTWVNLDTGVEEGTTATLEVQNEGLYELTVLNTTTGCFDVSQVQVDKSDDLPTMVVTETDITCFGENDGFIVLSDQLGGDGNYMYSLNGGTPTSDPTSFINLPAGDYTVSIQDGIGCANVYEFTITEPEPVSVAIAGEDLIVVEPGDEVSLTINPVGETIDSIIWTDFNNPEIVFCNGGPDECTSITLTATNTQTIYVEVFDANGCSAFDQVQIQPEQIVDVVFPNIISPNGDGTNDWFHVASNDVETVLSMKIFDRWGELIWVGSDMDPGIQSNGWDGKFKGRPVVPGVYVFTVEILFNDPNATRETFSGDVTVTDGD